MMFLFNGEGLAYPEEVVKHEMATAVVCTNCGQPYPTMHTPYRCGTCGGLYDFNQFPSFYPKHPEIFAAPL